VIGNPEYFIPREENDRLKKNYNQLLSRMRTIMGVVSKLIELVGANKEYLSHRQKL
jgi:hypothetical protein